ncbi:MAG: hypothetical protein AAGC74_00285 [Verrucomicrobiota bacterium]
MKQTFQHLLTLVLLVSAASGLCGQASFVSDGEVAQLKRENRTLRDSLVAANKREKQSGERLKEIRLRLEALGVGLVDGGDDRLVKAVQDLEVMSRKMRELEEAAMSLSNSTQSYLTSAIAADPEARMEVEARLRDLDAVIGLREKPVQDRNLGSLQQATVVSVDSESGAVVVNVGEKESAVIGMPFEVLRSEEKIAEGVLALVRPDVSALLITDLENETNPVRRGDRVSLKQN